MNLLLIMQEIHLSSYQCYRMAQSKSVQITNYSDMNDAVPICPPSKLAMRVIVDKNVVPIKTEKSEQNPPRLQAQLKTLPTQNVRFKLSGLRFVHQNAVLKSKLFHNYY